MKSKQFRINNFSFFFPSYNCYYFFSYKKRNDEKTPGKLSDANDELESVGNKVKKARTKKMYDSQQENQQYGGQENIGKYRRGKVSIAKSLQYGNEQRVEEAESIPLYRFVFIVQTIITR